MSDAGTDAAVSVVESVASKQLKPTVLYFGGKIGRYSADLPVGEAAPLFVDD